MARLRLVKNPNKILRAENKPLEFPLKKETHELIDAMKYACRKFRGVGLAAPQVGKNFLLAIIDIQDDELPAFPIINPKIVSKSKLETVMEEGCLSLPGKYGNVKRPEKVTVEFYSPQGEKIKIDVEGFIAKVFQHEIDHLNGVIISDKWDEKTVRSHEA